VVQRDLTLATVPTVLAHRPGLATRVDRRRAAVLVEAPRQPAVASPPNREHQRTSPSAQGLVGPAVQATQAS